MSQEAPPVRENVRGSITSGKKKKNRQGVATPAGFFYLSMSLFRFGFGFCSGVWSATGELRCVTAA